MTCVSVMLAMERFILFFLSVLSYSIKLLAVQELVDREALEKVF